MRSKSFYQSFIELGRYIKQNRNKSAGELWLRVKSFLLKGEYSSYKKAGEISSLFLEQYEDTYIASYLGIEESTVRVHRRNLSNTLYKIFGGNFFDLFYDFDGSQIELEFRVRLAERMKSNFMDLVPMEVISVVSKEKSTFGMEDATFDLSSCTSEISFLVRHSKVALSREVRNLDINKINYLFKILQSKSGSIEDLSKLVSLLEGGDNSVKL